MMSRSSLRSAQALRAATPQPQLSRTMATIQSDLFKPAKYGGKYTVTLIPGDGIGAEVAESVKTLFKADNVPIEWEQVEVTGIEQGGGRTEAAFRVSVESLKRNKLGLKGILHTPVSRSGHQSFNVALRQELDIYASISLIKNIPGYETRHKDVDLCIIRENTEGEYSGLEHQSVPGVVESLKIITRANMLLRHLGLDDHANRISKAIYAVIAEGKVRTRDMGGVSTTHEFTRAILDKMETS
ncbi:Isocitrate dehydrogenase (NAD) subunit 1, mitochondrial [Beauveria bassiana]|nr:Isocitrate dehydrogenase (NAD) subunit 1, mitochondrial [Beauveria bassiana]